ncbi:uncharacterized protein LOC136064130 [Quercus suber]|uniref:uncharacterized protein LOC136064130 n=1 Tax=Quercus suber TaxID=58331 RepID=UPI0032E0068C
MHLQGVLDEIMCRVFPTTLKGPARVWFNKILLNTITSFQELSKLFVNDFVKCQRHNCSSSSLLHIKQGKNESLRTFINRFNREALLVDEMEDEILLTAFNNGVTSDLFIHKLEEPQIMANLIHSALRFMNAKDTIIAKKKKKAKRVEAGYMHHPKQGPHPKNAKMGEKKRLKWQVYLQVRFVNLYEKWMSYLTVHFDENAQK